MTTAASCWNPGSPEIDSSWRPPHLRSRPASGLSDTDFLSAALALSRSRPRPPSRRPSRACRARSCAARPGRRSRVISLAPSASTRRTLPGGRGPSPSCRRANRPAPHPAWPRRRERVDQVPLRADRLSLPRHEGRTGGLRLPPAPPRRPWLPRPPPAQPRRNRWPCHPAFRAARPARRPSACPPPDAAVLGDGHGLPAAERRDLLPGDLGGVSVPHWIICSSIPCSPPRAPRGCSRSRRGSRCAAARRRPGRSDLHDRLSWLQDILRTDSSSARATCSGLSPPPSASKLRSRR